MSSTKTQESKLPQWQEDFIREQILPRGIDIAETEYTPYTGETIAGMTPLQEQGLSGFGGLNMGQDQYQQASNIYSDLGQFETPMAQAARLAEVERMRAVGQVGDVSAGQLSSTDFDPYLSPYTQNVIDLGQQDIERQRQMASNTLGAQAEAAGAFGGSRQAVQEGVLAGEALRQAGALSAQQRQQAFTQALQSGQFDISGRMQADTLNQQAAEAGAAREQAARAGNMAAANQFAVQQAQFQQQANLANQQAALQAASIRASGASGLGSTAGQQLQSQVAGLGAQMSAGEQQRALEQAQLQSDYAMFQEQQAYPLTQLNALLAAGSGVPAGLGTVTTRDPFGGLTGVGKLLGGVGAVGSGGGFGALF